MYIIIINNKLTNLLILLFLVEADKATANEIDSSEEEEEDPIIEDVSRVDLTHLEVISR